MKISELSATLESIKNLHGDLDVVLPCDLVGWYNPNILAKVIDPEKTECGLIHNQKLVVFKEGHGRGLLP